MVVVVMNHYDQLKGLLQNIKNSEGLDCCFTTLRGFLQRLEANSFVISDGGFA
jgi:hypothetical protein